ncbi:hypothetical protein TSA6c_00535 [Azospirillum sp. TSA6c]|uniref:hypothetical protein n=1 Tax=Azospirillum sp. TSA6c TaxID=709813 RepID=UPI000D610C0F|nr:hypothetical protein [Azospirillum sp. TSA6c]PWC54385.1 hypothetical protein TSA6c_00535 [Azospirillum sp. TSA6c]
MAFSDAEKTDIRRYCGYPVYGQSPDQFVGYRFFTAYGNLEYKMQHLQATEEAVVRSTYLANLATLETAVVGSSDNLDTAEAGPWKWNSNEIRDRTALLDQWRRKLCGFLGVPPGPELGNSSGGMRIVV